MLLDSKNRIRHVPTNMHYSLLTPSLLHILLDSPALLFIPMPSHNKILWKIVAAPFEVVIKILDWEMQTPKRLNSGY